MLRNVWPAFAMLVMLALAGALSSAPVAADTSGSFAGTVSYINDAHIGVDAPHAGTHDYLLASDFTNVVDGSTGKPLPRSSIKVGQFVTVEYLQSPLFGSTRATKVIVGNPMTVPSFYTPGPLPATFTPVPSPSPT